MAAYFIKAGWKDILIAIPFNINEIKMLNKISEKAKITITTDSVEHIKKLTELNIKNLVNINIETDNGYHRTGIEAKNYKNIEIILSHINKNKNLNFTGFFSHFGDTYHTNSKIEIINIYKRSVKQMIHLKNKYQKEYPNLKISIGDTPSISLISIFSEIDEIRPGNFIFYDLMQYHLGSCELHEIAAYMACPVIGKYPERNELVVYGGAVHFSKDYILNQNNNKNYGQIIGVNGLTNKVYENCFINALSQEHGIISANKEILNNISIGDTLNIIPIHSCLTADLMPYYIINKDVKLIKITKT